MPQRTWIGGATAVAHVKRLTLGGTWEANDVLSVTLKGRDGTSATLDVVSGSTTIATIATTLQAAIAAWAHPFSKLITAVAGATYVDLTANTAGVPILVTVVTTENGGGAADAQTFVATDNTANAGPNAYATATNWLEGAVPIAADSVRVTGAYSILYDLDQSGVALDGFVVAPGCSAAIGEENCYLKIALGNAKPCDFYGTGEAWVNVGASTITVQVFNTASSGIGKSGLHLLGSAMTKIIANGGTLEVAQSAGLTSTVTTVETNNSASVILGTGVTATSYNQTNGAGDIRCALTNAVASKGAFTTSGSGAITNFTNNGANAVLNSSGTVANWTNNAGSTDFTQSEVARTVTNATVNGGSYKLDPSVVTLTNKINHGRRVSATVQAA